MAKIFLAFSIIMVSAFLSAQTRADNEIDIPMKFVWNGKIIQPASGNSQSWSGINGEGWWGFWEDYYYSTSVRRIIMMEYFTANYFMKSGFENVGYAAKSHGDWTMFGSSLWTNSSGEDQ